MCAACAEGHIEARALEQRQCTRIKNASMGSDSRDAAQGDWGRRKGAYELPRAAFHPFRSFHMLPDMRTWSVYDELGIGLCTLQGYGRLSRHPRNNIFGELCRRQRQKTKIWRERKLLYSIIPCENRCLFFGLYSTSRHIPLLQLPVTYAAPFPKPSNI